MKIIDRAYVEAHTEEIAEAIIRGDIFIYPTDTIYGLGCNALLDTSVIKIREIKKRDTRPFSIAAPSKEWIEENCEIDRKTIDKYLPGPYTLFVRRGNSKVSCEVNFKDDTIGVRIPKHWFASLISQAGVPFVSTSVNLSGERHMEKLEDVEESILNQVDYCVYEGQKIGESSEKIKVYNQ
ncbi:MAG: L-threonylcarbamoyladenylate synthase [Parcubacteria group bacterium]